ncbi:MAG: hypothetical protein RIG82_12080 [Phycisphaeraceae bacterium]
MKLPTTRNLLIAGLATVAIGFAGVAVVPAFAQPGPRQGMGQNTPGHHAEMTCPNCGHEFMPPPSRGPRGQDFGDPRDGRRGMQGQPRGQQGFMPPPGRDGRGMSDRRGPRGNEFGAPGPGPERGDRFGDRRGPGGEPGMAPPRSGQPERGQMLRELFRGVDLDDAQRDEVMEIAATFRGELEAWHETNEQALRDLMAEARDARELQDRDRLQSLMAEFRELRQTAPKLIDSLAEIRELLTTEQFETFDANVEQAREEMERRMQGARERGGSGEGRQERPRGQRDRRSGMNDLDSQESSGQTAENNRQDDQLDL